MVAQTIRLQQPTKRRVGRPTNKEKREAQQQEKPFREARKLPSKSKVLLALWNTIRQTETDREKIAGFQALLRHMPEDSDISTQNTLREEIKEVLAAGKNKKSA